ncbi:MULTISPECIES: hypothetical protein [unclassified Pseudomonas]|uniref:hypothetical protein n=1 Tax=unclassified Pseudomonas TaxID=196821 RepID=UPI000483DE77|nr:MULTISPECIES: hypothetical protein [unclassified Pseudomonas]PXX72420.1 hypothetical protein D906_00404 [Pseudomonas sp. LAIL14HWK12:I1]SOC95459.1 hypothetical protein SAMN05660198_00405 [Pseudomonas sp. LAIL14HWK12:I3]
MSVMSSQARVGEGYGRLPDSMLVRLAMAQTHDWGAFIDAYLIDGAAVGDRFAAYVYHDRSGQLENGMTVVTPAVEMIAQFEGMVLLRTMSGNDNYVLVSRLEVA